MSTKLQSYLLNLGVATSRTTPYNPKGNAQCERFNGIIWKSIMLALRSKCLPVEHWEKVVSTALHSIRSLISTSTNETPHERLFNFSRKASNGNSLPSWLSDPGPVFLRKFVRNSKFSPIVEKVELLQANPNYAHIRFPSGRESTVSLGDLAPCGDSDATFSDLSNDASHGNSNIADDERVRVDIPSQQFEGIVGSPTDRCRNINDNTMISNAEPAVYPATENAIIDSVCDTATTGNESADKYVRTRSGRISKPPIRFSL